MTTTITERDREVSEACRNSGSRAERDQLIADYREEVTSATAKKIMGDAMEELDYRAEVEQRVRHAEQKLARIRQLVTHDKPLQGEPEGTPRFVVKGCEVLAVLDEEAR